MKKIKCFMTIICTIITILAVAIFAYLQMPVFGATPKGERLERIKKSPNYRDGKFQNLSHTPTFSTEKSIISALWDFNFKKPENLRPSEPIPSVKTDLKAFDNQENVLVWLGHSSYYFQIDGKKFLVDPVLVSASPLPFGMQPFEGADIYQPDEIPAVDYLVISHDHFDHLDYKTITLIKNKVGKIVTGLGVGAHFERWGIPAENIIEMDWYEDFQIDNGFKIMTLPARHRSGRGLKQSQSLWASFMLESPSKTIYIGGDSGYDSFFKDIAKQFPNIDLAILENGQYDTMYRYIHLLPEDLVKLVKELKTKRLLTFLNSKYVLGNHPWNEPLEKIYQASKTENFNLSTPKIGEIVDLNDDNQQFEKWWR